MGSKYRVSWNSKIFSANIHDPLSRLGVLMFEQMLPDDVRSLIIEMKDSMEVYANKTRVHTQLKCEVIAYWFRNRIRHDIRYATFLLLN